MTSTQADALIHSTDFEDFLAAGIDRCEWITSWLESRKIPHKTVVIQGKKHVVVVYKANAYNEYFRMKTLIAHYDRTEGAVGANDNSAACLQLLNFAEQLLRYQTAHNIKIIFTDGEESGADGIDQQGAYNLGRALKKLNKHDEDMFVFDMCGTGDCLILSESGIWGRKKEHTKKLEIFHRRCCTYANAVCIGNWYSLPTAYSDNAGLISAGLTAHVITVLPKQEAKNLLRALPRSTQKQKKGSEAADTGEKENESESLQNAIINNKKLPSNSPFASVIPKTWQRMHTASDSIENLTPEAFILIDKFLHFIAGLKEPVMRKNEKKYT